MAATHAGITPVWASEIEKFPCAVTAHHFPEVKQLGDITKINGAEIEPVDIITAGSPCQDLSIAGKRDGLDGARSGLFRRAVDIVRQMQRATNGRYPRWFVWENVPGAFSSSKGLDFRAVLEEIGEAEIPMPQNGRWANAGMAELPKCEIAWRVLDAQCFGVPQRRKRIFLVADFAADGRSAGEVLFEPEGLRGNPSASGGTREGTAATTESGTGTAVYDAYQHHGYREGKTVGTLTTGINRLRGDTPLALEKVYPVNLQIATRHKSLGERTGLGIGADGDNAYTLEANHSHGVAIIRERGGKPGGGKGPLVSWDKSLTLAANANDQVLVGCYDIAHKSDVIRPQNDGKIPCMTARYGTGGNNVPIVHCIAGNTIDRESENGGNGKGYQEDVSYTLNTMDRHSVAYSFDSLASNSMKSKNPHSGCRIVETAKTLDTTVPDPAKNQGGIAILERHAVSTYSFQAFGKFKESEKASTIRSRDSKDATDLVLENKFVRKLTPLECERLQGLEDNYTLIDDKSCSDSARYKAIGNGMAQPCADYVIRRIAEVTKNECNETTKKSNEAKIGDEGNNQ